MFTLKIKKNKSKKSLSFIIIFTTPKNKNNKLNCIKAKHIAKHKKQEHKK